MNSHTFIVSFLPVHKRIPHQPDEFVIVDEVVRAAEVYVHAALHFLEHRASS
jgi:acetylornithine deacetylase/succinyl-diaminopimelate desuccinylase-like protein